MTKKRVTAPLTYNPGKGRPKEHLAYLNYQEMQDLKRLNGGNQERGPKGLPSFPPAGAMSGGSAKSPASTSTAKAAGSKPSTGSSSVSRISGGTAGSNAARASAASKSVGGSKGSTGSVTGSRTGGGIGGMKSGPGATGGAKTPGGVTGARTGGGGGGGAAPRSISGIGSPGSGIKSQADRSSVNSANKGLSSSASNSPALKNDRSKTIGVGPMGTPVTVRTVSPGERLRGAGQGLVPARTIVTPTSPGAGGGFGTADSAQRGLMRGSLTTPVGPTSGVTARRDFYGALNERVAQMQIADRARAAAYPSAPQGVFGPRAGVGTGYLRTGEMPGMITTGMPSPYSGSIQPRFNAEATLRAYEDAKRMSPTKEITSRVPTSVPGASYVNPQGVPKAVADALAARGFNPDGTKMTPAQKMAAQYGMYRSPPGSVSAVPVKGPLGTYANPADYPAAAVDSGVPRTPINNASYFGDIKQPALAGWNSVFQREVVDPVSKFVRDSFGAITSPDAAVPSPMRVPPGFQADRPNPFDGIYRETAPPTTRGLLGREDVNPMVTQGRSYATVADAERALSKALAKITERDALAQKTGLPAVPMPRDMGVLSPPRPQARPEDFKRGYDNAAGIRSLDGLKYPGADGITGEDAGGFFGEEGDGSFPVPGDQLNSVDVVPSISEGERAIMRGYSLNVDDIMPRVTPEERAIMSGVEDVPESEISSGEDVNASPSQGGLTEDQRKEAQKILKRGGRAIRGGTAIISGVTGLPLGIVGGRLSKKYQENKLKQLESYAAMTRAEKLQAERRNPELIGWARELGIDSVSDYSEYQSWATERGLRAPPSREGGGGIYDIVSGGGYDGPGYYGGGGGGGDGDSDEDRGSSSSSGGPRPEIYYSWDLGVNIPSPGDPNYTQYQTYLIDRAASQRAMGWV